MWSKLLKGQGNKKHICHLRIAGWIFHCNSQWSWYLANIYSYVQTYPLHLDLALWGSLHSVVDFNVYPLAKSASISFSIFFRLVPSWIVGSALLTIINGLSCQFVILFHLFIASLCAIAVVFFKSYSYGSNGSQRVYSFDHVAINDKVTACDMKKVPLADEALDVAIFSLSLMSKNWHEYIKEANDVLWPMVYW